MSQTLSVTSRAGRPAREARQPQRVLRPRVDLVEREREWTLLADLPGVTSEAISIQTEKGKLVLRAERSALPEPPEGGRWLVRERPLGRYEAVFELGDGIDGAAIAAELKSGVLVVHLPKTERVQPRKVEVRPG
jgi:HSP20 family protein